MEVGGGCRDEPAGGVVARKSSQGGIDAQGQAPAGALSVRGG
jgi:hypothetical protein